MGTVKILGKYKILRPPRIDTGALRKILRILVTFGSWMVTFFSSSACAVRRVERILIDWLGLQKRKSVTREAA